VKQSVKIEVCAADLRSVEAATAGGADRIELCVSLPEGGVTPSLGMVQSSLLLTQLPVRVLIRPRPGDFTYNDLETKTMVTDIRAISALGIEGFVVGALTPQRTLDERVMEQLIGAMGGLPWTLHRAFDFVPHPDEALETAIVLGADTILTSGQKETALAGAGLIARLVQQAHGRIDIMAGGGVTPETFRELWQASRCPYYHLSGRSRFQNMLPAGASPKMCNPALGPDHFDAVTDPEIIQILRKYINL